MPRQLDALTGLRFLAAFHVVLFHLTAGYLTHLPAPIGNLLGQGPESVTLFFILSGFVLVYTYRDRAADDPRLFWWARVARIYPVYLLTLLVALPMFLGHPPQYDNIQLDSPNLPLGGTFNTHLVAGLACLLLLQAWLPPAVLKWNYPGWSRSAEAFFYAVFPWLSAILARQSPRRLRQVALATCLASIGMTAGWWVLSRQLPPDRILNVWWGDVRQFNPLIRLPEFVIGMVIGFRFMDGTTPAQPDRRAVMATVAIIGIWMVRWTGVAAQFENSLLIPIYATLVLSLAYGQGRAGRWLASPTMVSLGKASYALYLVHAPIIFFSMKLFSLDRTPGPHYLRTGIELLTTAAVAVGASLLIYRFVEEPARQRIRRWSGSGQA